MSVIKSTKLTSNSEQYNFPLRIDALFFSFSLSLSGCFKENKRAEFLSFPHNNLQNCHTQKPTDAHIDENTHKYTYIKKLTPQSVLIIHHI